MGSPACLTAVAAAFRSAILKRAPEQRRQVTIACSLVTHTGKTTEALPQFSHNGLYRIPASLSPVRGQQTICVPQIKRCTPARLIRGGASRRQAGIERAGFATFNATASVRISASGELPFRAPKMKLPEHPSVQSL